MNDITDANDAEAVAAAGFVAAKSGESFQESTLQPWTPARKIAAQSMGMLYPLIGDAGFEQLEQTGAYPGVMKDVVIFVWLRTLQTGESPASSMARAQRAQRKPAEAWAIAEKWAEAAGLCDMTSPAFTEAYKLFSAKIAAEAALHGTPSGDGVTASAATDQKKSEPDAVVGLPHDGGGDHAP